MRKDILLLLIGIGIASIFFYIKDLAKEPNVLNSKEQSSELNHVLPAPEKLLQQSSNPASETVPFTDKNSPDNKSTIEKVELTITKNTENDNFAIDDEFQHEPLTIASIEEFDLAFEEQDIDHDWRFAVESEILLDFTDSLNDKSVWIESYECKYSLCRIEIKLTDRLEAELGVERYIGDSIKALSNITNTSPLSIPGHSKDKNVLIFFLKRQKNNS